MSVLIASIHSNIVILKKEHPFRSAKCPNNFGHHCMHVHLYTLPYFVYSAPRLAHFLDCTT